MLTHYRVTALVSRRPIEDEYEVLAYDQLDAERKAHKDSLEYGYDNFTVLRIENVDTPAEEVEDGEV